MVYDDDTGEPVHIPITDDDYPSRGYRSAGLSPSELKSRIISLANQHGWGPHSISEYLKTEGYSVSVSTVRRAIADDRSED
jgi:hypothetical protein